MILTQDDLRRLSAEEKRELAKRALAQGDVKVEGMENPRPGYVTIAQADGSVRQEHYTRARTAYYKPGSLDPLTKEDIERGTVYGRVPIRQEFHNVQFGQKDYVRRTPNQRLDSMTKRLVDSWRAGFIDDVQLKEIAGEYWKMGSPITVERLRAVAAQSLQKAENTRKDTFRKKATSPWAVH